MVKNILPILILILLLGCDNLFFDDEDIAEPLVVYDAFYKELDEYFSFFPYLTQDFDSAYHANRIPIEQDPDELINSLNEMIQFLKDGHTNVFIGNNALSYNGWFDQYPANVLPDISDYFASYTELNDALSFGRFKSADLGYIKINTFTGNIPTAQYEAIDTILGQLEDFGGIVIDVRSNGGGNSNNADLIISRFNDEPRLMFRRRTRLPSGRNDFTEWIDYHTEVYSGFRFTKPVMVLTNRKSYSSTEWFVSGMRTIPHVTIVGDTTGGGSGNPIGRVLPNGWSMRISNTQKQLPEGYDFQYVGIPPDIAVSISQSDSTAGIDTILEKAIEILNQ